MPAKKKLTTVEYLDGDEPEKEVDDGVVEVDDDTAKVIEELADQAVSVLLSRRNKQGRTAYVGTFDAGDFSMELVRSRFGGGRYTARFKNETGIFKTQTFYIDESLKPDPDGGASGAGGNGELLALVRELIERRTETPTGNPMEIAAEFAKAAASQSQAQMTAMVAMLGPVFDQMAKLAGGGGGAKQEIPWETMAGLFSQGMEAAASISGERDSYLPVIKEVGLPLVKVLQQAISQRAGAGAPLLAEQQAAIIEERGAPVAERVAVPTWAQMLAPYMPKIVEEARNGGDTALWAALLESRNPRMAQWIEDQVATAEQAAIFKADLLRFFPALVPVEGWVSQFLLEFAPEPDEPDNPDPEPDAGGDDDPLPFHS